MDISPIKSQRDYRSALKDIEGLMMAKRNTPDGDRLDAEAHRDRLRQLVLGGLSTGDRLCSLTTDPHQMSEMIEAAGPIVAWT